jgi:chromosome transmission fidelity protein 18
VQSEAACSSTAGVESSLWVDRYRPRRFTDLLGDDRVHREVMEWVKEWDYCVFGKRKGKKRARDDDNPDEYRRPHERVSI